MNAASQTSRTRLAVFGSVAAERPIDAAGADRGLSPAVGAVLERIYAAIAADAAAIAAPILDRAVADGQISRVERHELLRELGDPPLESAPGTAAVSLGARSVLREALVAIRRAAPGIAEPILDEALMSERVTAAQRQRILDRLRIGPAAAFRRRPAMARGGVS